MTDSEELGPGVVLTWRRRKILRVIEEYATAHGCSPSNREIAEAVGLKSASSVLHHLRELKAEGFLSYEDGSPRTVRLLRPGEHAAEQASQPGVEPGEPGSPRVSWVPLAGQVAARADSSAGVGGGSRPAAQRGRRAGTGPVHPQGRRRFHDRRRDLPRRLGRGAGAVRKATRRRHRGRIN